MTINVSIMIATPHVGLVDPRWIDALLALEKPADGWYRGALIRMEVAHARNLLVRKMLENAETTHLLFWDDDVLPPRDGLMKLLAHDAPIVSGFYTSRALPMRPIAYRLDDAQRYQHVDELHDGLNTVDGVGCGFLLIRRSVFERISSPWFQYVCVDGDLNASLSEDLYFCELARAAGIPVLLDTDVRCGHIGSYVYDYRDIVAARAGS